MSAAGGPSGLISKSTSNIKIIPWERVKQANPKISLGYEAHQTTAMVAEKVVVNNNCTIDGLILADTVVLMSGSLINGVIICNHLKEAGGDVYGRNTYKGVYAWAEVVLHPDQPSQVTYLVAGPDANSQYSMIRQSETLADESSWMDKAIRDNVAVIKAAAADPSIAWLAEIVDGL